MKKLLFLMNLSWRLASAAWPQPFCARPGPWTAWLLLVEDIQGRIRSMAQHQPTSPNAHLFSNGLLELGKNGNF
ncbi:hypothetical protein [Rhodoferax sp. UBA5149]|uniref:hypothetical protein n=1 Tax=Rhodoferax sp. UBA5149 TaxID=1947379 RepID=UPI0025DF546F|nr:hypothetical protein [Rhodoferax sp. UBA5149]